MENFVLSMISIASYWLVGILIGLTPFVTRKQLIFGVTIPVASLAVEQVKKWQKQFFLGNLLIALVLSMVQLCVLKLAPGNLNLTLVVFLVGLFLQLLAMFGLYVQFHKKVKAIKQTLLKKQKTEKTYLVLDTNFRKNNLVISNYWFILVGGVGFVAMLVLTCWLYPKAPDQLPTHWGISGKVDDYSPKTLGAFLLMPMLQLLILGVLVISNQGIKSAKQKINGKTPQVSVIQNQKYRLANSRLLFISLLGINLLFLQIQLFTLKAVTDIYQTLFLPFLGLFLIAVLGGGGYLVWCYGQGGERYVVKDSDKLANEKAANGVYDDDDYWKLGFFYYNPKDPAIWVEERFGVGFSLNYGNPKAWMLLAGMVTLSLLLILVPFFLM